MMKNSLVILIVALICCLPSISNGQSKSETNDQEIFLKHSDECLDAMAKAAKDMSVKGACVIAFIPGNVSDSWLSKMKVAGSLQNGSANYLAVAYTKAAEMADTFKKSGSGVREPMHGEFGYQGGVIKKIDSGYILAAFSGATGEQDEEIAQKGLDLLAAFF